MVLDNTVALGAALLILAFLGLVTVKVVESARGGAALLEALTGHVAVPALIFMIVSDAPMQDIGAWGFVLAAAFAFYLTFMAMFVVAVTAGRTTVVQATIDAAAASHGSAGLVGIPLAAVLFGFETALSAVLLFATGVVVGAVAIGAVEAVARPRRASSAALWVVRSVFLDPKMLALAAGIAAGAFVPPLPDVMVNALDFLGQGALALAFLALGARLGAGESGRMGPETIIIVLFKLVVSPAIMLVVMIAAGGFEPAWISLAVIVAALPATPGVIAAAAHFDADPARAAAAVRLTTMVSVVTVPTVVLAIASGILPMTAEALLVQ